MEPLLFQELMLILCVSSLVVLICSWLKIPSILGFLFTGVLLGPHALQGIHSLHEVEMIAEIGIVFLLFTIGIEFSFARLLTIRRIVLQGGLLQTGLTIFICTGVFLALGQTLSRGIFMGFLMALSSTAIVLKLMQARVEMESPHGQITLGILIFQDLVIVPMMLFTPLLAGKAGNPMQALLMLGLKSLLLGFGIWLAARWITPRLFSLIVSTRNQELFVVSLIALCLLVAWLSASLGLSLSLGAFLAGLIISESEYSHQAMSHILPFRDIFISFFFVSVGMLLNLQFLFAHLPLIVGLTSLLIAIKFITSWLAVQLLGFPLRTALLSALTLAQIGEFSFVLSRTGVEMGLLSERYYQLFLAVSVLSMVLTPLLMVLGPRTTEIITRLPLPSRFTTPLPSLPVPIDPNPELKHHLVIIGFGLNGQNLARVARASGIPYAIIEANFKTVQAFQAQGEPIFFGDAAHPLILKQVALEHARVGVIAISDPAATRQVTVTMRHINPRMFLIVRTRFVKEIQELLDLGADAVIPEEFETSIEIFTLVLRKYFVPEEEIASFISQLRSDSYRMLRSLKPVSGQLQDLLLQDLEIFSRRLEAGAPLVGKNLINSQLRQNYGVTVLAICRNQAVMVQPDPKMRFQAGDILVLLGSKHYPAGLQDLFRQVQAQ